MADEYLPPVLAAALEEMRRLAKDRMTLVKALAEVDGRIAKAAIGLGLDPKDFAEGGAPVGATPTRKPQGRSREGTMTEFIMQKLSTADDGLSRAELSDLLNNSPFAEKHRTNPNAIYNIISRGLRRREISEQGRRLYHVSRPPQSNVEPSDSTPLFGGRPTVHG